MSDTFHTEVFCPVCGEQLVLIEHINQELTATENKLIEEAWEHHMRQSYKCKNDLKAFRGALCEVYKLEDITVRVPSLGLKRFEGPI